MEELNSVELEQYILSLDQSTFQNNLYDVEIEILNRMKNKNNFSNNFQFGTLSNKNLSGNSSRMRDHVMINNFESTELGTRWAISVCYIPSEVNENIINNYPFLIGNLNNVQIYKNILFDVNSNVYYNANVNFMYYDSINEPIVSKNNNNNLRNIKLEFDKNNENYNAFKAVNSKLCRRESEDDGIRYTDKMLYNLNVSLLSNKDIVRDVESNELYQGNELYQENSKLNIQVVDAENENVLFGLLKIHQPNRDEKINVECNQDVNDITIMKMTNNSSFNLPISLTINEFNNLFNNQEELNNVGHGYNILITSNVENSGGYKLTENFRGFEINDDNIVRNTTYIKELSIFSNVFHSIEIENGDLVIDNNNYLEQTTSFFEILDEDEKLDVNNYLQNCYIKFFKKNREERATNLSNSQHFMRITYEGENGLVGVLPNNRTLDYNLSYSFKSLIPSTDMNSNFLSENISKSNDGVAIICSNTSEPLQNGDITFIMTPENLDNPNDINLIHITQKCLMSNENGSTLYYVENDESVKYQHEEKFSSISVLATNVYLYLLRSNDIKLEINPKKLSEITQWEDNSNNPLWVLSSENSLHSSKNTFANIMDNNIQTIFDNKYDFLLKYKLSTNIVAKSIELLNYEVEMSYVALDENGIQIDELSGIEIYKEDDNTNDFKIIQVGESMIELKTFSSVHGMPMGSTLKLNIIKKQFYVEVNPKLSGFDNLLLRSKIMNEVTLEFFLENPSGGRLPDKFISKLSSSNLLSNNPVTINIGTNEEPTMTNKLSCRRYSSYDEININDIINNNTYISFEHSILMNHTDLYGFYGYIVSKNENNEWIKINDTKTDVDCVFDNETNIIYEYDVNVEPITLSVNIDIPIGSTLGNKNEYYIELSNEIGMSTFDVEGYSYNIDNIDNFDENWDPYSNDVSIFFPNGGSNLNLTTLIERIDENDDPSNQNEIILKIFNGNNIVAQFTSRINIASNFNIILNKNPILKVIETFNNNIETYYITEQTEIVNDVRYMKVIDGVELALTPNLNVGDINIFQVDGDQIECKPYPDYSGVYSTILEINEENGQYIGDELCRNIKLNAYRGIIENAQINLIRTPTKIQFKILNANDQHEYKESDNHDLYDGSIHVVDNINELGNLGLNILGKYSRFTSNTILEHFINVTHGLYHIEIINPLNNSLNQSLDVYTSDYIIKQFNSFDIVASRVKIYNDETYSITVTNDDLEIYIANTVADCANINAKTYEDWTLLEKWSDDELRNGVIINNDSQIHLLRTSINVQEFTEYYSLPRPQFKIEAISPNDVDDIPYNFNPSRRVAYCDINFDEDYYPFYGNNNLNNIKLSYVSVSSEKYTDKRLNPKEEEYEYFSIKTNSIKIFLKNSSFIDYSYDSNTDHLIYDGEVHLMPNVLTDDFSSQYDPNTSSCSFNYKQPLNINSSIKNLMFNSINIFGTGNSYIEIKSESLLKVSVYGITLDKSLDGSSMDCTFVKYNTNYPMELFNLFIQSNIKNINFLMTSRYTTTITYTTPELTNVPYTLDTLLQSNNLSLTNLNWTQDQSFVPKYLSISICALSTIGIDYIVDWINVNTNNPIKFLLIETPDLLSYKSSDGSPIFKITYSGVLMTSIVNSYKLMVALTNQSTSEQNNFIFPHENDNSQKIVSELFNYNITDISSR